MASTLRLMEFNPLWRAEFDQTKSSIFQATEGWIVQCEHIGSTAVDGAIARPTIDVLAGLEDMSGLNNAAMMIEGLNFRRLPAPAWCDDELVAYLEKPRSGQATHSVLAVRLGGVAWKRSLEIRESLRNDVSLRQRLDGIKRDNFSAGCQAEANYEAAKHSFFSHLP